MFCHFHRINCLSIVVTRKVRAGDLLHKMGKKIYKIHGKSIFFCKWLESRRNNSRHKINMVTFESIEWRCWAIKDAQKKNVLNLFSMQTRSYLLSARRLIGSFGANENINGSTDHRQKVNNGPRQWMEPWLGFRTHNKRKMIEVRSRQRNKRRKKRHHQRNGQPPVEKWSPQWCVCASCDQFEFPFPF